MSPKPALFVCERALQQRDDLLLSQRLQHIHAAARKQRGNNFERRILRGRADQPDVALLHVRKKRILLGFVEAMNLVDENDGARAVLPRALRVGHHLLDFLDPGSARQRTR